MQKLGFWDFWQIPGSVLNKGKSAVAPLFNSLEVLCAASDKAKLFAKMFSKNYNLEGLGIPAFPLRTNLKLYNISVTPKIVKKVFMNLDSSKAHGPDCIAVVVFKNCEPEFSYIVAVLSNIVSEGVFFSRLLEGLIGGPRI